MCDSRIIACAAPDGAPVALDAGTGITATHRISQRGIVTPVVCRGFLPFPRAASSPGAGAMAAKVTAFLKTH